MPFPPLPGVVHPILVHFTLGLVPAAAGFATWHAWRRAAWARPAALVLASVAGLLALVTMMTGFVDYNRVAPEVEGTPVRDLLEWHERLGVVAAVVTAATAAFGLWKRRLATPGARWAFAAGLLVASALVGFAGWFGGSLVYDHAVSVAGGIAPP